MSTHTSLWVVLAIAGGMGTAFGCSSANSGSNFGGGSAGGGQAGNGGGSLFGDGGTIGSDGGILTGTPPCNNTDPNADNDHDGFTQAGGDCNDCTDQMNPGAYDYPGNGVDEDCNGTPDDEPSACDVGLPIDGSNPMDAAKSLGLCRVAQGDGWGVVSAKWVAADGSSGMIDSSFCDGFLGPMPPSASPNPLAHGILPKFGNVLKPRAGQSFVALSSGVAREGTNPIPGDSSGATSPGTGSMCTQSTTPQGFPKDSPSCNGVQTANDHTAHDPSGLELVVKVPTNAKSLSFDFDFYTFEFPVYVCSEYNDFFVALLTSQSSQTPADKNISFDSQNNPVSVNNGYVQVCQAQSAGGKNFPCALGTAELAGTGFDDPTGQPHAATSWLQTKAAVVPGETITLRFAIWDMGDEVLDSTVIVDNFQWDVAQGSTPVTQPIPK